MGSVTPSAAYETLIIYGSDTPDADQNQPISFRIWDASKGIAYTDANIQVPGDQVPSTKVRKVLIDGILYIERNGEKYDATGKRVSEK